MYFIVSIHREKQKKNQEKRIYEEKYDGNSWLDFANKEEVKDAIHNDG